MFGEGFNMSKLNLFGIVLCIAGLVMVLFQAISSMMTAGEIVWKSLSIVDIVSAEHLKWIDTISWHYIRTALEYIAAAPIYILLLCMGGVSLLIGGFTQR
jgi:hypothetical protein